jgi:hypothetical protein
MKIRLNSSLSWSNGTTRFFASNASSMMNSSQKQDSSISSITMLSLLFDHDAQLGDKSSS